MPNRLHVRKNGIESMSLNVNYTALYNRGIDPSVLKDVSAEILRRAAEKNNQYMNNQSTAQVNVPAKPLELGIDLYQGKVDTGVQKQIATNNSVQFQFNNEVLQSIQFLNSQAAISRKNDGKYIPSVNETVTESQKSMEASPASQFISIFASASSKDKEGSNPFYNGELLADKGKSQEQEESKAIDVELLKSIFA